MKLAFCFLLISCHEPLLSAYTDQVAACFVHNWAIAGEFPPSKKMIKVRCTLLQPVSYIVQAKNLKYQINMNTQFGRGKCKLWGNFLKKTYPCM